MIPKNVIIHCKENGGLETLLVLDWIKTMWCRQLYALLHPVSVLMLDSFRGHLIPEVKKLEDTQSHHVVTGRQMTAVCSHWTSTLVNHLWTEGRNWLPQ